MLNIYLKVTIENKNWHSQNFDFLGLKNLSPCQLWGAPIHKAIPEISNFLLQLKNQRSRSQTMCNFSKLKILHTVLGRQTLCFSSYKNEKLKIKLIIWACERKKWAFFVPFILSEGFLKKSVLYLNV